MPTFMDTIIDFIKDKTGKQNKGNFFERLPDETILSLLRTVIKSPKDLIAFSLVDKRLATICSDEAFWRTIGFASYKKYLNFALAIQSKKTFKIVVMGMTENEKSAKSEFMVNLKRGLDQTGIDNVQVKMADFSFNVYDTPFKQNIEIRVKSFAGKQILYLLFRMMD